MALSRVRSFEDVRVWVPEDGVQGMLLASRAEFVTDNIVFPEVFR